MSLDGMRGADQQQNHIFCYLSPEARVRNDHPLRAIRAMVDEVAQTPQDPGQCYRSWSGSTPYLGITQQARKPDCSSCEDCETIQLA
jgi:hypothetical protein